MIARPAAALQRILVLRGGAVGDFILTGPVFAALRAHAPGLHIELAGYPRIAKLARLAGWADSFRSLDHPAAARLFAVCDHAPDLDDWGESPARFDAILSFLHDPDHTVASNLRRIGCRTIVLHPPLPPPGRHAGDHLLQALKPWGISLAAKAYPEIRLSATQEATLARMPSLFAVPDKSRPPLALHAGSGGAAKRWPLERYLALAERLRGEWTPIFTFGEADRAVEEQFARLARGRFAAVAGLALDELAAGLASCAGFIGNDCGIAHLAAALGVPSTVLFGPSAPAIWAPRNPNVRIVAATSRNAAALAAITPQEVEQSFRQFYRCGDRAQRARLQ